MAIQTDKQPRKYTVEPVYKALVVLQTLVKAGTGLTLTELAHRAGLPKTTVFRYLYTLKQFDFVGYDGESMQYRLGQGLLELGQLASSQVTLRQVARPFMERLRERFNETVNLAVLDGSHVVYVDMVQSTHSLRMLAIIGGRDRVYSTALGKAMLAFMPEAKWINKLTFPLRPETPYTKCTYEELMQDLELTRHNGYAIDNEENEQGVLCIAAPIFNHTGQVVSAISISGPVTRLRTEIQPEVIKHVMRAAQDISLKLLHNQDSVE